MTPTIAQQQQTKEISLTAEKSGLDIQIAKDQVTLRKEGKILPIQDMQDFVSRMKNDASAILKLVQKAYEDHAAAELAENSEIPWQLVQTVDGAETLVPFEGFLLEGEKFKSFNLMVLQSAKLMFGYPDDKPPKDANGKVEPEALKAWQNAKDSARKSAVDMYLSAPATVAMLKK